MADPHNNEISFTEAAELTARYRELMASGQIKGGFFHRDAIQTLINQPWCIGMRFYYGLDEENDDKQCLVLVAVDEDGNDMVKEGNVCFERSLPCPDNCGENN